MYQVGYLTSQERALPSAEFEGLAAAARMAGCQLTAVSCALLTEQSPFDFILSPDLDCRKNTSHPTFLVAAAPRAAYVSDDRRFSNARSFDGYLCASAPLVRFFSHLSAPLSKIQPPVCATLGPPSASKPVDLTAVAAIRAVCSAPIDLYTSRIHARLARSPLAAVVDDADLLTHWRRDGCAFAPLSLADIVDEIVPQALLQAAAAGVPVICPDLDHLRAAFGDSVFFYTPFTEPDVVSDQIEALVLEIEADRAAAAAMARRAVAIVEQRFGAAAFFSTAADYVQVWREAHLARATAYNDSPVDVIIRAGGRPVRFVQRALDSLEAQTAGLFRVIIVCYRTLDLSEILAASYRRVTAVETLLVEGGNRSRTLIAGMKQVRSPSFLLLDDDDYFLSDHVLHLLEAAQSKGGRGTFAYADVLKLDEAAAEDGRPAFSVLQEGEPPGTFEALIGRFTSHCFLASSDLLQRLEAGHWQSQTAEDGLLVFALLNLAEPVHAPGATCVYCLGRSDGSAFRTDPARHEDELALVLEASQVYRRIEGKFPRGGADSRRMIAEAVQRLTDGRRDLAAATIPTQAAVNRAVNAPAEPPLLDQAGLIVIDVPLGLDRLSGAGTLSQAKAAGPVSVTMGAAWETSVAIDIGDYLLPGCGIAAEIQVSGADQPLSLALLGAGWEVLAETQVPAGPHPVQAGVAAFVGASPKMVALRAAEHPSASPVTVTELRLGYDAGDLGIVFGSTMDADQLASSLRRRLEGGLTETQAALRSIGFRSPSSRFSSRLEDAPLADGAARTLLTGRIAWDYFAQIFVSAIDLEDAVRLRFSFEAVAEPFFLFLADSVRMAPVGERVLVRPGDTGTVAWLPVAPSAADGFIIFQGLDQPGDAAVVLKRIEAFGP